MKEIILGKSVSGKDVNGYLFGDINSFNKTLIIGCIHGVEPQSKEICDLYIEDAKRKTFSEDSFLLLIPCINPDGLELKTRGNANGVDLNRNFPSSTWQAVPFDKNNHTDARSPYYPGPEPASEPETKIILDLIGRYDFKKVISIHTNHFVQNPNPPMINYDGEFSKGLAEKLSMSTGLISQGDIGYPTPGSLGGWIGKDLNIISITIELDDLKNAEELYKNHGKFFEVSVSYV